MPTLKLKRKAETNEWVVVWYDGNKRNEDKSYYTDDKKDAEMTMADMQRRIDNKEEGYR